jgi:hypothetical protein
MTNAEPPPKSSRVTDAERFAVLHDAADDLLYEVTTQYVVERRDKRSRSPALMARWYVPHGSFLRRRPRHIVLGDPAGRPRLQHDQQALLEAREARAARRERFAAVVQWALWPRRAD